MIKFNKNVIKTLKLRIDNIGQLTKEFLAAGELVINCGFYESFDLYFQLKNKKNIVNFLYNNRIFHNDEDIEFLTLIKKYEGKTTVEHVDEYKNINIIPGGVFKWDLTANYPKKWRDFLLTFHSKYCEDPDDATIVVAYLILFLRALLRQKPVILKCDHLLKGQVILGYTVKPVFSSFLDSSHILVNNLFFDLENFKMIKGDNPNIFISSIFSYLYSSFTVINDPAYLLNAAGISFAHKNIPNINYFMVLPYEFFKDVLISTSLKILLDSFLHFPNIGINIHGISAETQKEYKKIVDEEYEQILSFLICSDSYHGPILDNYIKEHKKQQLNKTI